MRENRHANLNFSGRIFTAYLASGVYGRVEQDLHLTKRPRSAVGLGSSFAACTVGTREANTIVLLECTLVYFSRIPVWVFPCLGSSLGHAFPSLRDDHFSRFRRWRPTASPCSSIYIRLHPQEPTKRCTAAVSVLCRPPLLTAGGGAQVLSPRASLLACSSP